MEQFRYALGTDDIVFAGSCDIHNSMLSGWRKDGGESRAEDCKVYKMAIYLEDHCRAGRGFSVRAGSHHDRGVNPLQGIAIARAGDVSRRVSVDNNPSYSRFQLK